MSRLLGHQSCPVHREAKKHRRMRRKRGRHKVACLKATPQFFGPLFSSCFSAIFGTFQKWATLVTYVIVLSLRSQTPHRTKPIPDLSVSFLCIHIRSTHPLYDRGCPKSRTVDVPFLVKTPLVIEAPRKRCRASQHRPLLHGVNDTSKGTVT